MKAFLWSGSETKQLDGSAWYRTVIVADALRAAGHDIGQSHTYDPAYDDAHAILAQRVSEPGPSINTVRWIEQGRRVVYDTDDDVFTVDPSNARAHTHYANNGRRLRVAGLIHAAAAVTVCSPVLADRMRTFTDDRAVRVIPNGLPAALLDRPPVPTRNEHRHRPVTIGMVATESTVHDFAAHPAALAAIGDVVASPVHPAEPRRLHAIGRPAPQVAELFRGAMHLATAGAGMEGQITEWAGAGRDYLDRIDFDVWVAPYRDTPFNQAKGATKALEAMFLGIPLVASNIGPYAAMVRHGITGYLVDQDRPEDWRTYVEILARDLHLRRAMSRAARVEARRWTVEGFVPLWEAALFGDDWMETA